MAQAYDSIGLEEIKGAVLMPTERQLALTYLNMSEKDFAKSDVVPEGIKYEYFKRHAGMLGVVGDCLAEHTQDYRRAMLAFKKVWMERQLGPKIDPARLAKLAAGVDASLLRYAQMLAEKGVKIRSDKPPVTEVRPSPEFKSATDQCSEVLYAFYTDVRD